MIFVVVDLWSYLSGFREKFKKIISVQINDLIKFPQIFYPSPSDRWWSEDVKKIFVLSHCVLVFWREMPAGDSTCGHWDWTWGSVLFARGVAGGWGTGPCWAQLVRQFARDDVGPSERWIAFGGILVVEIVANLNLSWSEYILFVFLLERLSCVSFCHREFSNICKSRDA